MLTWQEVWVYAFWGLSWLGIAIMVREGVLMAEAGAPPRRPVMAAGIALLLCGCVGRLCIMNF
jgi:hypothetical protein